MNLRSLFGMGGTDDFKAAYEQGAPVVDVRTPAEFAAGHFPNSKNIPLDQVPNNMEYFRSQDKPIILICRSGGRAGTAKNFLAREGIEALNGGGWEQFQQEVNA